MFQVVFNHWSGDGGELNGAKGDDSLSGSISLSVPVCYMRNPNPRSPTRPFRAAHIRFVTRFIFFDVFLSFLNVNFFMFMFLFFFFISIGLRL